MRFEIKHRPSYSLLEVELEQGGAIRAEAGAMTYVSNNRGGDGDAGASSRASASSSSEANPSP
ncbi:MAG: AIM24 family protein [Nitrososphaerota archaeon]